MCVCVCVHNIPRRSASVPVSHACFVLCLCACDFYWPCRTPHIPSNTHMLLSFITLVCEVHSDHAALSDLISYQCSEVPHTAWF